MKSMTTLGEILEFQRGHDLPEAVRRPGTVPVIGSAGITGYHDTAKVRGPGVTIGRSGASFGKVTFVSESYWPHNAALFVKNFKGNDVRFVAYLLESIDFSSLNSGSAQQSLNRNYLYGIPVKSQELIQQRRIADILSAYDDLIENNTKRIKILEEMARSLYREWFVSFRFPGRETKLVSSSNGKLPSGWEIVPLESIAAYINRGIAPKYTEVGEGFVINQKCVRDQRLALAPVRQHSSSVPAEKYVQKGDVLINSTGIGTLGRVAQVLETLANHTVDTHVTIVRPEESIDLHYFGMMLLANQSHFEAQGVGATGQTELSRSRVGATEVLVPPTTLQNHFGACVGPMRAAALILSKKNDLLRQTRDLLLPRLISGEIDVSSLPFPSTPQTDALRAPSRQTGAEPEF